MSLPTSRPRPAFGLALALILAGCDQPTAATRNRARSRPIEEVAEAPEPPEPPVAPKPILGKRTQDIREMEAEKKAGGVAKDPKITARDPIRLAGNAYVSIIGQAATLNIKHALDLYQAETGEFPKTHAEFMDKIIKANNIALPQLPAYQDYSYDVANHKLQVMEYEDRKVQMNYPK